MVRAVVFDVGGVLALVEPMDLGDVDPDGTVLADLWEAGEVGRVTEAEVRRAMGERLEMTPEQVDGVMADMWRQYLGAANTELIAYVRTLRPGCRTGILSNSFVGAREREHAAYGFGDLVDELIYSHEAGMNKPDPRLWDLTCRRVGAAPGEIVFVDDSPALVDSARDYGMRGVLFEQTAQVIREVDALLLRARA
ncbi:HAD family phosphatase [Actinoplanes sp. NPDC051861]|uniref:HAD family hydrolase n=1 Tax=Actinoplanes sp. NPDC051861 TaxID=3155170 RepID=UPI0034120F01